ncbi:MAG: small ribosomal subunit biogenesis GTPase RsgA [Methylococcales bacterium]|jgi:ribosome biogenesis GTPase / thiamine phosphate phosphatase|nr:small ribosomal subunit biogenesis GTPase RsgA [Methylococcales bacterium]MBT7444862.1 small ribosomal subunit biogenesis GTPase RsgA [Methylococcales bacterium]
MSKRKLTDQQRRRIQANQKKRRQKVHGNNADGDTNLGPEQVGRIITRFGKSAIVQASDQTYRCGIRQHLNDLVCGDEVTWQMAESGDGIIVAINPRRNTLTRPDFAHKLKPVAANIDTIWIVATVFPLFDSTLIDQYTIAAEFSQIPPAIIFNKIDLLSEDALAKLQKSLSVYQDIGYQVLYASNTTHHGIDIITHELIDKTSVFVGQSGVGKSSLLNSIHPELELATKQVSEQTGLGTHTTSRTTLYHLPSGGELIDSPGVREFGLWHLDVSELAQYFVEFRPLLGQCKFSDCTHIHEPDCTIRQAVADGKISQQRYDNYTLIRERILENPNR